MDKAMLNKLGLLYFSWLEIDLNGKPKGWVVLVAVSTVINYYFSTASEF